jgi:hypothetical protein
VVPYAKPSIVVEAPLLETSEALRVTPVAERPVGEEVAMVGVDEEVVNEYTGVEVPVPTVVPFPANAL